MIHTECLSQETTPRPESSRNFLEVTFSKSTWVFSFNLCLPHRINGAGLVVSDVQALRIHVKTSCPLDPGMHLITSPLRGVH